ncbi:hypothetical protein NX029_11925 [Cytobacillus firmus]|nr:hypothetical protein [Cytobacillus firmus]
MVRNIIFAITIGLVFMTGCSNKGTSGDEKFDIKVEEVKELVSNKDWEQANTLLSEIPQDYNKEISLINGYVRANLVLESEEASSFEKIKNALRVLEHTEIDKEAKGDLAQVTLSLKSDLERQVEEAIKVAEIEEKAKVEEAYTLWEELINIDNDDAATARNIKSVLSNKDHFISKYKEDALILYYYAIQTELINVYRDNIDSQSSYNKSGNFDNYDSYEREFADKHLLEVVNYLKEIDPYTEGVSSFIPNVMTNLKAGLENFFFINEDKWKKIYNNYDTAMRDEIEAGIEGRRELSRMIPNVGMVGSDVVLTSWGKPIKINKTTTVYGVSEQWVYEIHGTRKYVYLEDGIVTGVQDY